MVFSSPPVHLFFLISFFVATWLPIESAYIAYNTFGGFVAGKLNVHLVPHIQDHRPVLRRLQQFHPSPSLSPSHSPHYTPSLSFSRFRGLSLGCLRSKCVGFRRRGVGGGQESQVHLRRDGVLPAMVEAAKRCGEGGEGTGLLWEAGAHVGFNALYFSRIDYQDWEKHKDTKSLEVVWRGSKTLGSSADAVLVYNYLGWKRVDVIRIPI